MQNYLKSVFLINFLRIPRVDIEGPTPTHTPVSTNTQHSQVGMCKYTHTIYLTYNIVF